MSFLRGASAKSQQSAMPLPQYSGLQIQTSSNAIPVAICYGMNKLAPNLIFYNGFHFIPNLQPQQVANSGVSGWFGHTHTQYTISSWEYFCDLMMGLCEGPVQGIGQVWKDNSIYGATTQTAENWVVPAVSPYQITVRQAASFVQNVSVKYNSTGILLVQVAGAPGPGQYSVAAGVYTFNSADAGKSGNISYRYKTPTVFNAFGKPINTDPLAILHLSLFNGAQGQAGWGYLAAAYPQENLNYSGTAYIAANNYDLGTNATIGNLNFEVKGFFYGTGANGVDADPAPVIADFLTNPQYGCKFPGANIDATSLFGSSSDSSLQTFCKATGICFSPLVNQQESGASILQRWAQLLITGAVWSGDRLRFVPYGDQNLTVNGVTWIAPVTPVYDLDDHDFLYTAGDDPVTVQRLDPFTIPNFQWLEVLNRAGVTAGQGQPQYQATPVSVHDQAAIEQFGLLVGSSITAHEICDLAVAQTVAQTLLQRQIYIRQQFTFKLSWEYCRLDPMDVVTLTDVNLGLSKYPVRIIDIEEDEEGALTIIAEELAQGVSTAETYAVSGSGGGSLNQALQAGPVNAPLIFEPPPSLTNNTPQLWLGASASVNGAADPNWGGCNVYASLDNISYQQIATIRNPIRQGFLTAPLASATGWDTTNTLAVDLSESGGTLDNSTQAAAQAGQTLCLVDGELLGFETATLTAANKYNLTGLARGLFNSCPLAHASGAAFARLDGAVAAFALPPNYIGKTLYLKFQSFNVFGSGWQDVSTLTVYTYTPTGNGAITPVWQGLQLHQNEDWGAATDVVANQEDWGTVTGCPFGRVVDLGALT
ncbi:phage tail protein [Methylocystis sp. MJC1]|uniref:phage tail protein n=1 Tax=Methylocystis sp. MJC1 TaxID=2654282 RepID=UPI0013EC45AA|nr:phage tail protein [Methylocystis sp. MJC1]KAF2991165.1 hypothetical protein MJC1_01898 [Methylocystis sp. MJC1]MBU6525912.1 phage tail protein [Methylocystis sp. MJC1]UZX12378.1 phage tail protein [Methylocystis sp. MJC1]